MAWSSTKHINITAPTCSLQGSQVQVSDLKCGQESLSWLQLSELESTLVIYNKGHLGFETRGTRRQSLTSRMSDLVHYLTSLACFLVCKRREAWTSQE